MSFLTINDYPAISCDVTMPLVGLWRVEADVDAPEAIEGPVTIEAPGLTLKGTAVTSDDYGGRVRLRIEAGAGRMAEVIGARFFKSATYRQIVAETIREVGESLDASPLTGTAPAWVRSKGPASGTVAAVASALGLAWGATDDGLLTAFSPTWAVLEIETAEVIDSAATDGTLTLGTTVFSARPGFTIEGRRVVAVQHHVSDVARTVLICEP